MRKTFCDKCGVEIASGMSRHYARKVVPMPAKSEYGQFMHVIVVGGVSTKEAFTGVVEVIDMPGDICLYCLIDAVHHMDDRAKPVPLSELMAIKNEAQGKIDTTFKDKSPQMKPAEDDGE